MSLGKDYRIAAVATGEHASAMEAVGQALSAHPDQRFRSYLVRGIREGFQIGFDGRRVDIQPVREKPEVVDGLGTRVLPSTSSWPLRPSHPIRDPLEPLWGDPKDHTQKMASDSGPIILSTRLS